MQHLETTQPLQTVWQHEERSEAGVKQVVVDLKHNNQ